MTFIVQPKKEGETKECDSCGVDLIARWTDYKGKWDDKLQWQTLEPRKAHYDKDGNCKDLTTSGTAHVTDTSTQGTITQESTVETDTSSGNTNGVEKQLASLNLKVESIYAMIKTQFDEYQERKSQ